jgi:hypothetical protein
MRHGIRDWKVPLTGRLESLPYMGNYFWDAEKNWGFWRVMLFGLIFTSNYSKVIYVVKMTVFEPLKTNSSSDYLGFFISRRIAR